MMNNNGTNTINNEDISIRMNNTEFLEDNEAIIDPSVSISFDDDGGPFYYEGDDEHETYVIRDTLSVLIACMCGVAIGLYLSNRKKKRQLLEQRQRRIEEEEQKRQEMESRRIEMARVISGYAISMSTISAIILRNGGGDGEGNEDVEVSVNVAGDINNSNDKEDKDKEVDEDKDEHSTEGTKCTILDCHTSLSTMSSVEMMTINVDDDDDDNDGDSDNENDRTRTIPNGSDNDGDDDNDNDHDNDDEDEDDD